MKTKLSHAAKIIYGAGDLGFSLTFTIVGAYFSSQMWYRSYR